MGLQKTYTRRRLNKRAFSRGVLLGRCNTYTFAYMKSNTIYIKLIINRTTQFLSRKLIASHRITFILRTDEEKINHFRISASDLRTSNVKLINVKRRSRRRMVVTQNVVQRWFMTLVLVQYRYRLDLMLILGESKTCTKVEN